MSANWPWGELGLETKPDDLKSVRSAYAKRMREIDRSDPQSFERLQNARKAAEWQINNQQKAQKPSMRQAAAGANFDNAQEIHHAQQPIKANPQIENDIKTNRSDEKKAETIHPISEEKEAKTDKPIEDIWQSYTIDDYWADFKKALSFNDFNQLSDLFDHQFLSDHNLRREAERLLYQRLLTLDPQFLRERSRIDLHDLLNSLGWLDDGIGLKKRLRVYQLSANYIRIVQIVVNTTRINRPSEKDKQIINEQEKQIQKTKHQQRIYTIFFIFWVAQLSISIAYFLGFSLAFWIGPLGWIIYYYLGVLAQEFSLFLQKQGIKLLTKYKPNWLSKIDAMFIMLKQKLPFFLYALLTSFLSATLAFLALLALLFLLYALRSIRGSLLAS